MGNEFLATDEPPIIICNSCPNSLKARNGESKVQLVIRAVVAERWKVTISGNVCKCSNCVERQVKKNLL